MKSVQEIRESFTGYFQDKKHHILESASLFPGYDPTLLFTTAGMVPFKPYFAGTSKPVSDRIATIQKCMRTTDLLEVGKTKRHLSFFEMLGNFSFGDYFKKEAIELAWEYSTEELGFSKEKIWITVYSNDNGAYSLWKDHIGIAENKIHRLGKKDNFWGPAGSVGACGPCSELYLDRGEKYDPEGTCKKPGDAGERFMEFWNLVFNQFYQNELGEYIPLQKVGIDTGAGLERIASLIQDVDNVFETDELSLLCKEISTLYGVTYSQENSTSIHILSDHIRALCFAIADGIFPSNESRGYVLRRMLRRAMLYGIKLNKDKASLHHAVKKVIKLYGKFYPELNKQENNIRDYITAEENRFIQTIKMGSERLDEIIEMSQETKLIKGEDAFLLYDTYGFPLEMTIEIAEQKQFKVDVVNFEEKMKKQRKKGRLAWKGDVNELPLSNLPPTKFIGYEKSEEESNILCIIHDKKRVQNLQENEIDSSASFYLVTEKSPFYSEGGGQIGDQGYILGSHFQTIVTDTQSSDDLILHICKKLEGNITVGDEVQMKIDQKRRMLLRRNHSATHLLHASLKRVLGDHIRQTGSLVHSDYLRFDFSHPKALTMTEIETIENDINEVIARSYQVLASVLPKKEAEKKGAIMTFGEKYGEAVRIVEIGNYSIECCGGTHVNHTGELGSFFITKEGSPGAGNRRIEAVSSEKALACLENYIHDSSKKLLEIKSLIKSQDDSFKTREKELMILFSKLENNVTTKTKELEFSLGHKKAKSLITLWQTIQTMKFQIEKLQVKIRKKIKKQKFNFHVLTGQEIEAIFLSAEEKGGFCYYRLLKEKYDIRSLKMLADSLREKKAEGIYILHGFVIREDQSKKWSLVLATSRTFAQKHKLDLGQTIKLFLKETTTLKGGGGGSKEMAQVSGEVHASVEVETFYRETSETVKKYISSKKNKNPKDIGM